MTDKEQRFIDEYCVDCNATRAAIRAGYSEKSARTLGCDTLTKPYIRAAIDEKLTAMALSANETTKMIGDIAKSSINPYLKVVKKERIPHIRVSIQTAIDKAIEEIEFEEEYSRLAGYNQDELDRHLKQQEDRQRNVIRLRLKMKKHPNGTVLIEGEPEEFEEVELDMIAITRDKEAGKIKSIKHTDHGIQIEMYPADAALANLARMHGLFEKDNKQLQTVNNIAPEIKVYASPTPLASSEDTIEE